ncbi:MAG: Hsp33 family molecular chaperone HslO [Betaproteobacteria bacterium]
MRTTDALTPFVFEHAAVRGAWVRVDATVAAVLGGHDYPPAVRGVLAELVAATTLLAASLKFTGSLIVQLQGAGPLRLLVVECTDALGVRATAQWDPLRVAGLPSGATLADLAGDPAQARLVMTLDPRGAGTIHQGIVALDAGSVSALIEHYLATSEQLASRIVLARDGDACAGLLLQRLPDHDDDASETWARIGRALDTIPHAALLAAIDATIVLPTLFPQDDLRVFATRPVGYACSCSQERVDNALRIAGFDEVESILVERGNVEVTCEFCRRVYTLDPAAARALFVVTPIAPGPACSQ